MKKRFSFLVLALLCWLVPACSVMGQEYDFAVKYGGNKLYYYITGNNTVEVTYPGKNEDEPWKGYRCPTGQVTIPEQVMFDSVVYRVTAIRYNAFNGCKGITHLVLPSTLTEIGEGAFAGCKRIKYLVCMAIVPPRLDESSFDGVSLEIPVRVPAGTYPNYQQAVGWRQFTEIVEF